MLKDIILSALVSTPLGLAMVAGILWLIRYGWRALRAAVRERSRRTEAYPSTASRSPLLLDASCRSIAAATAMKNRPGHRPALPLAGRSGRGTQG